MLYGKKLVITGAASGIGRRTAELALLMGAEVIGVDVAPSSIAACQFIQSDLSSEHGVRELISQLPDRLDGLCNIAGLSGKAGATRTLSVNFYGLRALSESIAPKLREGASIVSAASAAGAAWRTNAGRARAMVGIEGFPDVPRVVADHAVSDEDSYAVSKELLIFWTMRAAHQSQFKARGIRVNAVSPGPVETPILAEFREVLGPRRVDDAIARAGRAATPAEIAPVILFLCTDWARWINGANIPVDGGLEAARNAAELAS
jgi:NAD(P)-dependent dehydrogenase (short-subunit alcohol dehydrogenase family)